jgi:hypothetical protein
MITKDELLMGRDKSHPKEYTKEISDNLDNLLIAMNQIRSKYGKPMRVTSGWRPSAINQSIAGAAKRSNHMMGLAVDISDRDGELREWVLENLDLMQKLGVYIEDFRWTQRWVHFQIVRPRSGKRIFLPYADTSRYPMTAPQAWNGNYESKYDSP